MHPIFQWLDYRIRTTAVSADWSMNASLRISQPFVPASTLSTARSTTRSCQIRRQQGRADCRPAHKSENFRAMRKTRSSSCRMSRSSPARNISTRCASAVDFSAMATVRPHQVQSAQPETRRAVECRSWVAGVRQHFAQRRGAEFRRERHRPGLPNIPFTRSSRRPRQRMRSARGAAARTYLGFRSLPRPDQQRTAMPLSSFGNCNVSNAERDGHRGIEAGIGLR